MTFWASGSADKTPNDNTRLWSNFRLCPRPPVFRPSSSSSSSPFDPVPVKMIGFQESLHCAADEEVLFGGDVCVWECVAAVRNVMGVWVWWRRAWPGPTSSWSHRCCPIRERIRGRKVRTLRNAARLWVQGGRCKCIIGTRSRCHSKWLLQGGSMCANIDWHVCMCIISRKRKRKAGRELMLWVF